MNTSINGLLLACMVVAGCSGTQLPSDTASQSDQPAGRKREPLVRTAAMKAASCATAACHGDIVAGSLKSSAPGTELSFFHGRDPHAAAAATLSTVASQQMIAQLVSDQRDKQQWLAACAACHAPEQTDDSLVGSFGCISCHDGIDLGPDSDWLNEHVEEDWQYKQRANATTKNLRQRAERCVACHVGALAEGAQPHREVDHDMIAAGHPALKFELAAYHDLLPKHWSDAGERNRVPDFELRLWLNGQRASALAALDLARHHGQGGVWPEFAQMDCFRCHQNVAGSGWRPTDGQTATSAWGSWYFWMSELRPLRIPFAVQTSNIQASEAALRKRLHSWAAPAPSDLGELLAPVEQSWRKLPEAMRQWLDVRTDADLAPQGPPPEMLNTLSLLLSWSPPADWDGATQRYLTARALERALLDRKATGLAELGSSLGQLRTLLRFELGKASPARRRHQSNQAREAIKRVLQKPSLLETLRLRVGSTYR